MECLHDIRQNTHTHKNVAVSLFFFLPNTVPDCTFVQNPFPFGMLPLQLDFDTRISERNDLWQADPPSQTNVILKIWVWQDHGFNTNQHRVLETDHDPACARSD